MYYENSLFKEYNMEDIIEINVHSDGLGNPEVSLLTSNGDVKEIKTGISLLKDIVHIEKGFLISRNGSVYQLNYYEEPYKYSEKVCVYDEWIERMK